MSEDASYRAWIEDLPCLCCLSEQGEQIRHQLAQGGLERKQTSPNGLPINCCKVTVLAQLR